ncbi:MAG: hypothetical protein Q9M17_10020 [Mariprofundus sp.]|nr:hypothetical protein [Mariprofundus sp.]
MKVLLFFFVLVLPTQVFAEPGSVDTQKLYDVLLPYLVLAVVFEVALSPLFSWRIFLLHCEGKGYKTPITIFFAYVTFSAAGLDVFGELLDALGRPYVPSESQWWGQFLTAFLIAGGSSGIYQIFAKLGIRRPDLNKIKTQEVRGVAAEQKAEMEKQIENQKKAEEMVKKATEKFDFGK